MGAERGRGRNLDFLQGVRAVIATSDSRKETAVTAGTTLAGLPELPTRGSNLGNVVMIDDDPVTLRILHSHLRAVRCELRGHEDAEIGLQAVDEETRAALIDLNMPGMDGFECLHFLRKHHPRVQVIVLTGSQQTTDAVEAMRAGAFQFVTKPWDPDQLQVYLYKAFQAWQNETDRHELRESRWHNLPVPMDARDREAGDIHEQLQHQVNRIAGLDSTVFIAGESGTGKSTVARWIHQKSARRDGPFVTVNCAALPRDLLTSELFGHTKGAFTGADRDRAGHAEVADGGTLFLDEIGDLPLELQPKLLTFLQDRTIQRLGSTDVRSVDVRLIVATHRDLNTMCRDRLFREDLYFRLMVLPIELPPLRLRQGEAPEMAREILLGICRRMGMPPKSISPAAMRVLLEHSWPGNIRELENVLERASRIFQFGVVAAAGPCHSATSTSRCG